MLPNCYQTELLEAGCDEAGRGCLAGSLFAAAVILPPDFHHPLLNDSKQMTERQRNILREIIEREAVAWAVAEVTAERIDEINILQATYRAMREAMQKMAESCGAPDVLLNDAVTIPGVNELFGGKNVRQVPIIKGDAKSLSIAAASVIAKVTRDRMMVEFDKVYPGYGFAGNKGYGSAEHMEKLRKDGPCPIHRQSFIKGIMAER